MLCSIIITNHNYGKFLDTCIKSCLNQNFNKKQYEIIIVDDNSKDNSKKILKKYNKNYNIKIIFNKKNLGVAGSANLGIAYSRGEFVVRVDADDYISNDFLNILYLYLLKRKDKFCVACDYKKFLEKKKNKEIFSARENPVSCGIMYRKSKLIEYGLYNINFKHREEEELRKRLGSKYKIGFVDIPLYWYRMHKKNKTKNYIEMKNFNLKLNQDRDIEYPINYHETDEDLTYKQRLSNIVAIIPAKGTSIRLKNKNLFKINKKPMIEWVIKSLKKSKYINKIYISSEDYRIFKIAKKNKVKFIRRPNILSQKNVFKMDVIMHAVNKIRMKSKPTLVCSVQANSPDLKIKDLDDAIIYCVKNNLNEVISTDFRQIQNAAFRIMKLDTVFQRSLSTNVGFYKCQATDVHTLEDIKKLKF